MNSQNEKKRFQKQQNVGLLFLIFKNVHFQRKFWMATGPRSSQAFGRSPPYIPCMIFRSSSSNLRYSKNNLTFKIIGGGWDFNPTPSYFRKLSAKKTWLFSLSFFSFVIKLNDKRSRRFDLSEVIFKCREMTKKKLNLMAFNVSGPNWNQSKNGKSCTISSVHEKAISKDHHLSPPGIEFFGLNFWSFWCYPKIYWICAVGNRMGIKVGILMIWTKSHDGC